MCKDLKVEGTKQPAASASGVRLGVAPTIRVATKAIIVRDDALLVTVNVGDFPTFCLCPGGGQEHGEDAHQALRRRVL